MIAYFERRSDGAGPIDRFFDNFNLIWDTTGTSLQRLRCNVPNGGWSVQQQRTPRLQFVDRSCCVCSKWVGLPSTSRPRMILDSECLTTTFHTERKRRNKSGRGEIRGRKEVNRGAGSVNRSLVSRDCLIVLNKKPMGVLKSMWDETT